MAGLIVIEIVPQTPVDALTFQKYLTGLQIQVFDLSFATVDSDPPGGQSVGSCLVYGGLRRLVQPRLGNTATSWVAPPSYPGSR